MKLTKLEKERIIFLLENELDLLIERHAEKSSIYELKNLIEKVKQL